MWSHKKRIEKDLVRWREAGWVTAPGETAIRDELERGGAVSLAGVLSMLAAVLFGFAVMSFVGANWQDMSKLLRLALLLSLLWGATLAAGHFFQREMDGFGHACAMLGSAIFGANIMLISQMYHMDGNAPDAMLLWAAGAFVSGLLFRSGPTLALAMVLICYWAGWETSQRNEVFWSFVPAWAAVSAAFYWLRWTRGVHLSGLAMTAFIISLGFSLPGGHHFSLVTGIGLVLMALFIALEKLRPDLSTLAPAGLGYALIITFVGLMALQYDGNPSRDVFALLALVTLALTLAAVWWGLIASNRGALWLGYLGFSIEILSVYGKMVGSLMGTSLFFLIAALLVAALAFAAYRLNQRSHNSEALT